MNRVTLGSRTYDIPARWSEVKDRAQFIRICGALFDFETGLSDFEEFRLKLTLAVLGLDGKRMKESDILFENLFRISELLTFPYEVTENADGSRTANVRIRMTENLLPEIGGVKGYQYHTTPAGVVDTDLTAGQYTDALELLHLYGARMRQSRNADTALEILFRLVQTLYPLPKPDYSKELTTFSREEKIAVFYNYRGIMETLRTDPDYDLLFRRGESRQGGPSPVGSQGAVFALSKAGFGDIGQIRSLDIHTFLSAMVQQTVDSIHTLQGARMKPGQIADKLNLTLDQILPFVTVIEE